MATFVLRSRERVDCEQSLIFFKVAGVGRTAFWLKAFFSALSENFKRKDGLLVV